jgi:hypothetical protein
MHTPPMKTVHFMPNLAATVAVATPCCPAPVSAITLCKPSINANRESYCLPKSFCNENLTDCIVYFMASSTVRTYQSNQSPCVVEIFPLKPDLGTSTVLCKSVGVLEIGGSIHVRIIRPKFVPEDFFVYGLNKGLV